MLALVPLCKLGTTLRAARVELELGLSAGAEDAAAQAHYTPPVPGPASAQIQRVGVRIRGAGSPYTITPAFSLSAFAFSSSHANAHDGGVMGLDGQVSALDSDSGGFQISLPNATSVHVAIDSATAWQGIAALTDLKEGTFVDLDGALRADGSVAATRVSVADLAAVDVRRGPLLFVSNAEPILQMYPRQGQGKDQRVDFESYNFNSSTFRVSGALPNLQTLPFTPSFTAQNMVAGQAVYVSSPAFIYRGPYFAAATAVTLVPQTVNGTITGLTTSGAFTVYSVSLAPYEHRARFLVFASPGQTPTLHFQTFSLLPWASWRPTTIRVYQRPIDPRNRAWAMGMLNRYAQTAK